MALLQGFEEIKLVAPIGKVVVTITESAIRFNKSTAAALGYPAYVKVLVNEKTKQIALQACSGREGNAIKFSKPEGKQNASVSIKNDVVLNAVKKFFDFPEVSDNEIAYYAITGTVYGNEKVAIFNVDDATNGTMKKRGRKKA